MSKRNRTVFLLLLAATTAWGQEFTPYSARSEFLLGSPGSSGAGLYGYINPALLTYAPPSGTVFTWSDRSDQPGAISDWGLFSNISRLGFGVLHQELPGDDLKEYRISLVGGNRNSGMGLAYGWSSGNTSGRRNLLALGSLWRPAPSLSLGLVLSTALSGSAREALFDLGWRPGGSQRLTFFADYALASKELGADFWSGGLAVQVLQGLHLTGRYFDNETISIGLDLSLGHLSLQTQSRFDEERSHAFNTYALRLGAYEPSALTQRFTPQRRYLDLNLFGPVRHRKFTFFDPSRTLVELLALIERAKNDASIGGIAINLSGMRINPAMAWEVRQALQEFKTTGKRIVAYLDRADLRRYHFASVAHHIVLDPAGLVILEGLVAGQTYLKGALDKLGIGAEEWRFYDYKSAFESIVRHDMSDAERRQTQALIDDFYTLARDEICAVRPIAATEFDRLVDEETVFLPQDALKHGLIDELGRWDQVKESITKLEGQARPLIKPSALPIPHDRRWSERPRIAIVYALGICDMDTGIVARHLVKEIEAVRDDPLIRAVVLRVDSPGGDVLSSDLVAAEIKKTGDKKPVIVSQGRVAASGGYWISMYADAIVAAPNTLTGSIGVIGGWLYNQGLKEKMGLSTDHVQVGRHADLNFGITVPLLGLALPDRNLHEDEKKRMEHTIRALYADFVTKVAAGRDIPLEEVETLAQGRIWSGRAAVANGLVDELGGLARAVQLAKEKAGIPHQSVQLVERPQRALFNTNLFKPALLSSQSRQRDLVTHLQFRLEHNGQPLLLVPAETLETFYNEEDSK